MNRESRPEELLRLLPPIRRARGYRLYAEDGSRFLDLWQEGGRGVLGAKGTGLGTLLKEEVDKGRASPFPSLAESRLERELLERFPSFAAVRLYSSWERALAALGSLAGAQASHNALGDAAMVFDPARSGAAAPDRPGEATLLLRPFGELLDEARSATGAAYPRAAYPRAAYPRAIVLLPCPAAFSPVPLLFARPEEAAGLGSDLLPALSLAAAYRSLREYGAYSKRVGEADWRRADRRAGRLFIRKGPFLYPKPELASEAAYGALFRAALEAHILLSPDPELPSIIPGDFDDGELKGLERIEL